MEMDNARNPNRNAARRHHGKPCHPQTLISEKSRKQEKLPQGNNLFLGGLLGGLGDLTGTLVGLDDGLDDTDSDGLTLIDVR